MGNGLKNRKVHKSFIGFWIYAVLLAPTLSTIMIYEPVDLANA
jgi:hypothetical protein